jgi:uncharacterized protein YbbC (DUF1343 family)/CubicO group peptidase (beta-lactamase class C family)
LKRSAWVLTPLLLSLVFAQHASGRLPAGPRFTLSEQDLAPIGASVQRAIRSHEIPGAVILIGNQGKTVYRKAFGHRTLKPAKCPMTVDTIFDLASLTKTVATTTALLQLVENGRADLADPVVKYWPEFHRNGKEEITLHSLLTHYSGLRADLDLRGPARGYETALKKIEVETPVSPSGTRFLYSDVNFQILGELVRRISGQPLEVYCDEHIFRPLGMKDTCFNPLPLFYPRIAPSREHDIGRVQDPAAFRMGGVAGHAGLFSTADDLAVFARMLLAGGKERGVPILTEAMVHKMTAPQSPDGQRPLRGLGWDLGPPLSSNREALLPVGSYGHRGFTGTMIWIDPTSQTYIILLTNRLHPQQRGNAEPLRKDVISWVCQKLGPVSMEEVFTVRPALRNSLKDEGARNGAVKTGIDVLVRRNFEPLAGLRLGLITNHTGIDSEGRPIIDLLSNAPGAQLAALFSPEHGLSGKEDGKVRSGLHGSTGLPVYSLYGERRRPDETMLRGLDALVFDVQDAGVRWFTYITTMAYAMEAAAEKGITFFVLDRPNPITASAVQGPILHDEFRSFTGYCPLPVRHGMTIGELAGMFNHENRIGATLQVIKMEGYRRSDWYDQTGLRWVSPSPNLRTLTQTVLYPGVAMVEGANVSVGRGTESPFELLGAPWIKADELTAYLNRRKIQGVRFTPVHFTPKAGPFKDRLSHGVKIELMNRDQLDGPALGLELTAALRRLYPRDFQTRDTLGMIGSRTVLQAILDGEDPKKIAEKYRGDLANFLETRSKYLLY